VRTPDASQLESVLRYHERTKHHLNRFAAGPGQLDWANQPDPFRRYEGAALARLPLLGAHDEPLSPSYESLFDPGAAASAALTAKTLSRFFEYSLAVSAWKQAGGTRWALRANPSSGNLHPTEGYLLIGALPGVAAMPGVFHYAPKEHALERRADCPQALFARIMRGFPPRAFLVGLSSVVWREAWKYGERAFRYCLHDAGHALGALRIAAATLGWSAVVLEGLADETLETLLGLDREADFEDAERERAELVMAVWPSEGVRDGAALPLALEPAAVQELARQPWHGRANRLSPQDPVPWEIIGSVAAASRKPPGEMRALVVPRPSKREPAPGVGPTAGRIIRQRRSLQACDGRTSIPAERFYRMLARLMPRAELEVLRRPVPWDAIPWAPAIHLCLFVHRVDGLEPGLYALARDCAKLDQLKRSMRAEFAWEAPPGCPPDLPLRLLERGDARELATQVSCRQEIAGEGAFALGMIAEYREHLVAQGPWFYRRLFWEAGAIGQVLYLEAEAAGVRATGIGCYFDDPVHQVFGLSGVDLQSLYHFTVGGAVDDPRLTTLPAYGARPKGREGGIDLP
jgi:SagB-type dehydrogenase family enzyme